MIMHGWGFIAFTHVLVVWGKLQPPWLVRSPRDIKRMCMVYGLNMHGCMHTHRMDSTRTCLRVLMRPTNIQHSFGLFRGQVHVTPIGGNQLYYTLWEAAQSFKTDTEKNLIALAPALVQNIILSCSWGSFTRELLPILTHLATVKNAFDSHHWVWTSWKGALLDIICISLNSFTPLYGIHTIIDACMMFFNVMLPYFAVTLPSLISHGCGELCSSYQRVY